MDTSERILAEGSAKAITRRRRTIEEKRRIVEETLRPGASVSRVARRHDVNANQVFHWRQKYREGRLGESQSGKLLPVSLADNTLSNSCDLGYAPSPSAGSMEIKLAKGTVRIAGSIDVVVLRTALECLLG
jgi:transposase